MAVIRPEHESDVSLVALANDADDRFLTVVIADGAPSVFSEETTADPLTWHRTVEDAIRNVSINRVYLPETFGPAKSPGDPAAVPVAREPVADAEGKVVRYSTGDLVVPAGVRRIRMGNTVRRSWTGAVAIVLLGAGLAGWWLDAWLREKDREREDAATRARATRVEISRLDVEPIIDHCIRSLGEFWPMAPEWTLAEEGCVVDPETPPRELPEVGARTAYAYRLYELVGDWNDFLAGHAAEQVTGDFPGRVYRERSRMVLFQETRRHQRIVDATERQVSEPAAVLNRLFVGKIRIRGRDASGSSDGVIDARTPVELRTVLERIKNAEFETVHVRRRLAATQTGFQVRPARLRTETIRVGDAVDSKRSETDT
ncbi:MAG: hypothetical protein OXL68_07330 [Paracoccaceae bacterium]|nr:hypothetical protein [Paracoccaceae bacterium]